MESEGEATGGSAKQEWQEPAPLLLRLSEHRMTGRATWWLAERAHARSLYGLRHVKPLNNLWVWTAAKVLSEQYEHLTRLEEAFP